MPCYPLHTVCKSVEIRSSDTGSFDTGHPPNSLKAKRGYNFQTQIHNADARGVCSYYRDKVMTRDEE